VVTSCTFLNNTGTCMTCIPTRSGVLMFCFADGAAVTTSGPVAMFSGCVFGQNSATGAMSSAGSAGVSIRLILYLS
jgi:hypothetical protein